MSTYKRRVVYLSDDEWEGLKEIARLRQSTISATIRDMLDETIKSEVAAWKVLAEMGAKQ